LCPRVRKCGASSPSDVWGSRKFGSMEVDVGVRLQRLEAQVGDLQQRLEVVCERKKEDPGADVHARLQSLEDTMKTEKNMAAGRLQALSAEFQTNVGSMVSNLLQQVERGLASLEESAAHQAQHTEQTLQGLARKVEESLRSSATEIGDAALEAVLRQADSAIAARRASTRPVNPGTVVRQVSGARPEGVMPVTMAMSGGRAPSPTTYRALSPTVSVTTLRPESPSMAPRPTVVRAASPRVTAIYPDPMLAAAMQSPRADLNRQMVRGRSSEPRQGLESVPAPGLSDSMPLPVAMRMQPRVMHSPRGPSDNWLYRTPAALRPGAGTGETA